MQPLPPSTPTGDVWYTIVTILFALSLISERIANLIKVRLTKKDLVMGATRLQKKEYEQKVMLIALFCGLITSFLAGADLFNLLDNQKLLPLGGMYATKADIPQHILGAILTGFFISLGSKFWHDILDIVLQFANLNKYRAAGQEANVNRPAYVKQTDKTVIDAILQQNLSRISALPGYMGYEYLSDTGGNLILVVQFSGAGQPDADTANWLTTTFSQWQVIVQSFTPAPQLR